MSYLAEVLSWTFGAGTVLFSLNFVLSPLEGVANPEVQPLTRNESSLAGMALSPGHRRRSVSSPVL